MSEATPRSTDNVSFEVVSAFPGLTALSSRSPSLDGSLPQRAVKYCTPVIEGSAAGFQVVLAEPVRLTPRRSGIDLDAGPRRLQLTREAPQLARQLLAAGVPLSPWTRALMEAGGIRFLRDRVLIWTGLLVRARAGVTLFVTGAYNRGAPSHFDEYAIAPGVLAPLVLDVRAPFPRAGLWLDGEVACVLPIDTDVRLSTASLEERPDALQEFSSFYDPTYFAEKKKGPTAKYRRLRSGLAKQQGEGDAQLVAFSRGEAEVQHIPRYLGAKGFSRKPSHGSPVQFGRIRARGRLSGTWDGHSIQRLRYARPELARRLPALWSRIIGTSNPKALEQLLACYSHTAPGEPMLLAVPPAFLFLPPGWSVVVDGYNVGGLVGMRAVIASAALRSLSMVWKIYERGDLVIPAGAPMLRVLPVSMKCLESRYERLPLESFTQPTARAPDEAERR